MTKLGDLSNDELLARLRGHLGRGNVWLAGLLVYLGEVAARRLWAEQACTSMWDFCVRRLAMSESEAQRRIAAARVLREFPLARTYLERGQIHLCAIYELYKHITEDNHEELLREAAGKTTKAVGEMIAARFPKPDVHPCVEPLAPQPALPGPTTERASPRDACSAAPPAASEVRPSVEPLAATRYRVELTVSRETKDKLERVRDLMRHRNPNGDLEKIFDLSLGLLLTKLEKERLGKATREEADMRAVAWCVDGMNSAPPNGATTTQRDGATSSPQDDAANAQRNGSTRSPQDDAAIAQRDGATSSPQDDAADAQRNGSTSSLRDDAANAQRDGGTSSLRADVANAQRDGSTSSLRDDAADAQRDGATSAPPDDKRRRRRSHILRAVRREVFARDQEQCTYVDAEGNRCPARGFLELDHVKPKALGGSDDASNLRLRCRAHNRLHAEQVFGREYVEKRIHLRQRKYAPAHAEVFETAARGLRFLGFREPEVRDVIARLATSLDQRASVETVIRDALRLLT